MTKKTDRSISKALGIPVNEKPEILEGEIIADLLPAPVAPTGTEIVVHEPKVIDTEIDKDFVEARDRMTDLVNKANTAIEEIMFVAKESEQPRAYEVVAKLIETMAKVNGDIVDLHKKKREAYGKTDSNPRHVEKGIQVDKAIFVGTTTEMLEMAKKAKNESN